MSFSILTLNLWNVSAPLAPRYAALERGLKRLRPDVVCLQEADRDPATGKRQAALVAEMCGHPHVADEHELAIVSVGAITRLRSVALPDFPGDFPRRALMVETVIEGRPLRVTNTHLAYRPEMIKERKRQVDTLLTAMPEADGVPHVLCGDFNDVPPSPAVRAVLARKQRFQDAFALRHPDSAGFTYACRNVYVDPTSTLDQRIDYVFVSPDLVVDDCSVVFDGNDGFDFASDHFGVFCRLAFR
jgi:endonuclease/exonuclease/phosphatase family metal-dependent hydrolase